MREDYAHIGLYVDKDSTIYAIPCGWDRITLKGTVIPSGIDLLFILEKPYGDSDMEAFLLNALENCYIKEREPGPGALEKHFGFKSWTRAVKGLKCISFSWSKTEGYVFMPTLKAAHKGYEHQPEKQLNLGKNPQKGELAKALLKAISESTC